MVWFDGDVTFASDIKWTGLIVATGDIQMNGQIENKPLGNLPALVSRDGDIDIVVVYKVDRLSRSLLDFARVMERFNQAGVAFVSVTQNFSTADAMTAAAGIVPPSPAPFAPMGFSGVALTNALQLVIGNV